MKFMQRKTKGLIFALTSMFVSLSSFVHYLVKHPLLNNLKHICGRAENENFCKWHIRHVNALNTPVQLAILIANFIRSI